MKARKARKKMEASKACKKGKTHKKQKHEGTQAHRAREHAKHALLQFEPINRKELCSFTGVQEPQYEGKTRRQSIKIIT